MAAPTLRGVLVRRYKRFLADVRLHGGRIVTVHCPNPGSMLGLAEPGSQIQLSDHDGSGRKLRFTWEMVAVRPMPEGIPSPLKGRGGRGWTWVGVNAARANRLAEDLLRSGRIKELAGATEIRREVKVSRNARLDFMLTDRLLPAARCLLEVKSVTLARGNVAYFPDSVTERGRKHLEVLKRLRGPGVRCALLFIVQRSDVRAVRPADDLDPDYGRALRRAARAGVELYAWRFKVGPRRTTPDRRIPVELP
jgi:sugar fermentation stimulation protein A